MKTRIAVTFTILFFTACQTKQEYFTQQELIQKSDSLTAIRFEELKKQAAEDLELRLAIELKPKIDSILEGKDLTDLTRQLPPQKDSAVKNTLPLPLGAGSPLHLTIDTVRKHGRK